MKRAGQDLLALLLGSNIKRAVIGLWLAILCFWASSSFVVYPQAQTEQVRSLVARMVPSMMYSGPEFRPESCEPDKGPCIDSAYNIISEEVVVHHERVIVAGRQSVIRVSYGVRIATEHPGEELKLLPALLARHNPTLRASGGGLFTVDPSDAQPLSNERELILRIVAPASARGDDHAVVALRLSGLLTQRPIVSVYDQATVMPVVTSFESEIPLEFSVRTYGGVPEWAVEGGQISLQILGLLGIGEALKFPVKRLLERKRRSSSAEADGQ